MSKQNQEVVSKLIKITILSFLFMAVQFVGGYLAHSVAIWSDAFHLLSDVLAYAISLIAVILSQKKSPQNLTFGWLKAQTLGALLNVIFIYLVTIQLFIQATHRMIKKDKVEEPKYMLITSIFGLICNFIVLSILHNDPNGGHHGCSHNHGYHQHKHSHDGHQHTLEGHQHSHDGKPCKGHQISLNNLQSSHKKHEHSHNKQSCNHHHHKPNEDLNQHIEHKHEQHHHEQFENLHQYHSHKLHKHEHNHDENGCCKHQKTSNNENERDSSDQIIPDTGRSINKNLPLIEHDMLPSVGSDEQIKKDSNQNQSSKIKNINLEAAHIHIITDIILSIGVIIAAVIIYLFAPQGAEWSLWHLADPMCTYLFSILAIYSTWPILKESLLILLDGCDNPQLLSDIEAEIKKTQGVRQIKDLKIWSVNRGKYYAGVRVKLEKGLDSWRVKKVFTLRGIESFVEVDEQQLELSQ